MAKTFCKSPKTNHKLLKTYRKCPKTYYNWPKNNIKCIIIGQNEPWKLIDYPFLVEPVLLCMIKTTTTTMYSNNNSSSTPKWQYSVTLNALALDDVQTKLSNDRKREKAFVFFVKYFYWSSNTVNYKLLQAINLHIYTCTRIEIDYRNPTIINDVIYINKPVDSE